MFPRSELREPEPDQKQLLEQGKHDSLKKVKNELPIDRIIAKEAFYQEI